MRHYPLYDSITCPHRSMEQSPLPVTSCRELPSHSMHKAKKNKQNKWLDSMSFLFLETNIMYRSFAALLPVWPPIKYRRRGGVRGGHTSAKPATKFAMQLELMQQDSH
jgi:hypothetical protein